MYSAVFEGCISMRNLMGKILMDTIRPPVLAILLETIERKILRLLAYSAKSVNTSPIRKMHYTVFGYPVPIFLRKQNKELEDHLPSNHPLTVIDQDHLINNHTLVIKNSINNI